MKTQNEKILAGCVILYHPEISFTRNIESYLSFLDVLYVIDNSETVDNELYSKLKALSDKIIYLPQYKNIGVASALNLGSKLAFDNNYTWLLTMDQDSYFTGNTFFEIWKTEAMKDKKIGLIAASYTNEYDRWQKEYSACFNEIHFAVTSGNIINLNTWFKVNGFEEKLFIDEVDHDYCLKLRHKGYKILISKEILMGHVIGESYQIDYNWGDKKENLIVHSQDRYYYMSRNVLYLCKKYFFVDFHFVVFRFYYLIKILAKILIKYPDKVSYLKPFFKGIKDFILSRYDQYNK